MVLSRRILAAMPPLRRSLGGRTRRARRLAAFALRAHSARRRHPYPSPRQQPPALTAGGPMNGVRSPELLGVGPDRPDRADRLAFKFIFGRVGHDTYGIGPSHRAVRSAYPSGTCGVASRPSPPALRLQETGPSGRTRRAPHLLVRALRELHLGHLGPPGSRPAPARHAGSAPLGAASRSGPAGLACGTVRAWLGMGRRGHLAGMEDAN